MDSWTAACGCSFLFIALLIGVPVWWQTTTVYRAPLPRERVSNLVNQKLFFDFNVLLRKDSLDSEQTLQSLENRENNHPTQRNSFPLELWLLSPDANTFEGDVLFSSKHNRIYFKNATSDPIKEIEREDVLGPNLGLSIESNDKSIKSHPENLAQSKSRKIRNHHVDIYFAAPDPSIITDQTLGRFVKQIRNSCLSISNTLGPFVNIHITSQLVPFAQLPLRSLFDKENSAHFFQEKHLSQLINELERHITTIEPQEHVTNILVYLPPQAQTPLFALDSEGRPNQVYDIHGWGSFMIDNDALTGTNSLRSIVIQILQSFDLKLYQLDNKNGVSLAYVDRVRIMANQLLANRETALNTLESMIKLLDQINNIVISDEVASFVEKSVAYLESVHSLDLSQIEELQRALIASQDSVEEAEKAFFDPSLLALLYFPDDQKYAIYIPLFLPAAIPIVIWLKALVKTIKESRNVKTGDHEKSE